ncbi:hypothetical protein K432DRAFT_434823 [Lepidopterella palustris CBS 459.81]|uniref:U1-type domain-containing protein n=1 Tax=Lepidopterella palustris CBS 459.81 TaxID=1314670 RepID=A0A8E2EAN4_9PEZI|nr:hypothetical protein K432DRAFT_434823 [Lepidopterella palustris CBS 459.81]
MSEYWKSTPKYWCKFCKDYVRDTPFAKQQHDATPKHQGNIQRSLRDLHKTHEKEEREKQRAKDEVARLNGVVSGIGASGSSKDAPWKKPTPTAAPPKEATPEERKRQLAKLAEMGVAVPEHFRREMAMVGDWQVISEKSVGSSAKQEDDANSQPLNVGVRKRKLEGQDEEEEAAETITKKKGWGHTFKTFSGSRGDEDLEVLLKITKSKQTPASKDESQVKEDPEIDMEPGIKQEPQIKEEAGEHELGVIPTLAIMEDPGDIVKAEKDTGAPVVVFKKRKTKAVRPK